MEWIAAAIVLALFIYAPKKMFIVLGAAVIIGSVIGGYLYYRNQHNKYEVNNVVILISYKTKKCKEPYPLQVIVGNKSDRVVEKVEWSIAVHKPNFSTDISQIVDNNYSEDRILQPKEGWGMCVKAPMLTEYVNDPSKLRYTVKNKYVTFK